MPSVKFVSNVNYQLRDTADTGYIRTSTRLADARSTFGITSASIADTDAVAVNKPSPVCLSVVSLFSPIFGYTSRL
jgi:hypothetical protein